VDGREQDMGDEHPVEVVLDPGPIVYEHIELYQDADLEFGLRHAGFDPASTTYRLIEIPLSSIGDTVSMHKWPERGTTYIDAIRARVPFPPIVVMRTAHGWGLLDGVNRTHAYWRLGRARVQAYEVVSTENSSP
jgi:hypothetical protein